MLLIIHLRIDLAIAETIVASSRDNTFLSQDFLLWFVEVLANEQHIPESAVALTI